LAVILDANAVSAIFEGGRALEAVLSRRAAHQLPVVVIGDYRYGLARAKRRKTLEPLLNSLIAQCTILNIDTDTTDAYATVREQLRADGKPLPENDVWIAALAVQHDLQLVSRDAHFTAVRGLRLVSW
jgi:tRNA(fMet)-specific endonuclease VapC